jgi:NAD(P)H dehydrogenase (quinone)
MNQKLKKSLLFCFLCFLMASSSKANTLSSVGSGKVLIILAHPNLESFNHAIGKTVADRLYKNGHEVKTRDLYQLGFDPVMTLEELKNYQQAGYQRGQDILAEQEAILWADHLVLVYPTWWWSPPAILKGYLDRVFTPNFAFSFDEAGTPKMSPLSGKTVSIIQTTGADETFVRSEQLDEAVKNLFSVGIFGFCGMEVVHHEFLMGVDEKSYEQLKQVLQEVDMMVDAWF